MQEILHVGADNAVFVFAPTGIGAIVGLRLLPWFSRWLRKAHIVTVGLFGVMVALVLLASVEPVARILENTDAGGVLSRERPFGVSVLTAVTMAFAFPLGVAYAMVNAPAQTIIHERAPRHMRGRFFGTQIAMANLTSLVPLLLLGAVTDVVGVSTVLYLLAPLVGAVAVLGIVLGKGEPAAAVAETVAAPPGGDEAGEQAEGAPRTAVDTYQGRGRDAE
jgi:MFS family permease